MEISIGLAQSRFTQLERRLYEVSDPNHSDYGNHLTPKELDQLIRPDEESRQAVLAWLNANVALDSAGLSSSPAGDWMYLSLPVHVLEKLLRTKYFVFRHIEDGTTITRSVKWFLPNHIAGHIDIIEPTTVFVRPRAQWRYGAPDPEWENEDRLPTYDELVEEDLLDRGRLEVPAEDTLPLHPTVQEACNRLSISPLCLRVLYGTHGYEVKEPVRTGIGIVNFLGEVANRSDVQLYLEKYRPDAAAAGAAHTFGVELIAGAEDRQTPNTPEQMKQRKGYEGALDAQTVLGISWPVPLTTYNVGGKPPFQPLNGTRAENTNEPYLVWLRHVKTLDRVPQVISISYAEDEKTVPHRSTLAGGDYGVGKKGHCVDRFGKSKRFMPSFPASCPYVTAVGATRFLESEMVAFDARTDYASGGGFSDLFEQPAYQKEAVRRYLDKLGQDKFAGLYNASGRAFPDVAAMGYHFIVMWNGSAHMQDGTSASAPTVAAVIALINDALAAEGRPPLGFLNPWIYSIASVGFTDVTYGSNLGCNTSGFPALEGWDPASGLGTPWFPKLKELALKTKFRPAIPWYYLDGV
ncbi:hypothetical protein MFIFM68171_02763 [Madurella fahalii]|uniref:Peptidase S53 domain-containing protein n=1 Tax=Madurella fahalii TaxID=1157608 RepID=A0ABQ0G488_9PEZI